MTVTGSCHLLEAGGGRLLVDCGAFQGRGRSSPSTAGPGVRAAAIDAVLLTHAHLDHSGRLPVLCAGFRGPIHARPATSELCEHLLLDAAKIQREDAERDRRHGRTPDQPLFDEQDVHARLALMSPSSTASRSTSPACGHRPAGRPHPRLGEFLVEAGGAVVFSGDVGNARKEILPDPTPCPEADLVLMEGTYGDRDHRPYDATIEELAELLPAEERGGKILVPSFALERTHEVLYTVAHLERDHDIAPLPVYVDSPLAAKVDEVYDRFPEELSDELRLLRSPARTRSSPSTCATRARWRTRRRSPPRRAGDRHRGLGDAVGRAHPPPPDRRARRPGDHRDDRRLPAAGGLGRELIDGAERVRVMGRDVTVRARVVTVGGLSAHADRSELLDWVRPAGAGAEVRLVHGEPRSLESLRDALAGEGMRASLQPSEVELPEGTATARRRASDARRPSGAAPLD